jgi:putative PIN family toxin of toxin-antitoxin system
MADPLQAAAAPGRPKQGTAPSGGSAAHAVASVEAHTVVIDTNVVLDLLVFNDPATAALKDALHTRRTQWLATPAMRDELARVLVYPQITPRLAFYQLQPADVLAAFDAQAQMVAVAPRAQHACSDADDQHFIDLAVAHRALLLSKDKAVLSMRKRLVAGGFIADCATTFVA